MLLYMLNIKRDCAAIIGYNLCSPEGSELR